MTILQVFKFLTPNFMVIQLQISRGHIHHLENPARNCAVIEQTKLHSEIHTHISSSPAA